MTSRQKRFVAKANIRDVRQHGLWTQSRRSLVELLGHALCNEA